MCPPSCPPQMLGRIKPQETRPRPPRVTPGRHLPLPQLLASMHPAHLQHTDILSAPPSEKTHLMFSIPIRSNKKTDQRQTLCCLLHCLLMFFVNPVAKKPSVKNTNRKSSNSLCCWLTSFVKPVQIKRKSIWINTYDRNNDIKNHCCH